MSFLAPTYFLYFTDIYLCFLILFFLLLYFSQCTLFGIVDLPQCRAYLCSTRPVDSCRWYQGSCVTGTAAKIEKREWTVLRHCIPISLLIHTCMYRRIFHTTYAACKWSKSNLDGGTLSF